jgi:ribosome-binding protein aMBF1 (putative translation factor)
MKRHCDICGCEADEYWMQSYNTGRKVVWLCWDCYKNSQYEATKSDLSRQKKLYQIANSKKRHR